MPPECDKISSPMIYRHPKETSRNIATNIQSAHQIPTNPSDTSINTAHKNSIKQMGVPGNGHTHAYPRSAILIGTAVRSQQVWECHIFRPNPQPAPNRPQKSNDPVETKLPHSSTKPLIYRP